MRSRPDGGGGLAAEDDGTSHEGPPAIKEPEMYHPETLYELAKLRMAEDLRQADRERLVRHAGSTRPDGAIDSVPFRDRLARLFGTIWPSARDGSAVAGA